MSAWTPRPWRVEEGTTLIWGNCNPDDTTTYGMGYPIASAENARGWKRNSPDVLETEANAHLIAAAPDLYAALETCLRDIEAVEAKFGHRLACGDAARAALARARGEGV